MSISDQEGVNRVDDMIKENHATAAKLGLKAAQIQEVRNRHDVARALLVRAMEDAESSVTVVGKHWDQLPLKVAAMLGRIRVVIARALIQEERYQVSCIVVDYDSGGCEGIR